MQKKSLLGKAQEGAATAVTSPSTGAAEMALAPVSKADAALSDLLSDRALVASVVESSAGGTPYIFSWWGAGNQQPLSGVKKGDLVLATADGQVKLEPPVKGFLCTARQQWCQRVPATGQLVQASLEKQA